MPCEVVPLGVDFFKMAAVAMETAKMLKKMNQKSLYRSPGYKKNQLVLCKNYVLQW
jgi:hypothetical protein